MTNDPAAKSDAADLVRPYVITRGRGHPTRKGLDLVSLVIALPGDESPHILDPESTRLLALCRGGILSVAEVAGHLALPIGVVKVLLSDLMDTGLVATRRPIPSAELPKTQLLQEVLDGLARL
ncbi:DUF742 domain-containing protein [Embleya sp. NPDC055664]|uniref:DUF742 domain-containing protein n=1 Tax=Embleya sp. NPDC059237 TaxID=3346784 RepID=UPI0036CFF636